MSRPKGSKLSEEHKLKISLSLTGKKHSDERKQNMSEAKKGKPGHKLTEKHKRKISETLTGHVHSDETKDRISDSLGGRTFSEEHKQKLSNSLMGNKRTLGYKHTDKAKVKMSESHRGSKPSEETRRKIFKALSGSKSHFWKGGITNKPYCPKWTEGDREKIRNKYKRRCFLCNKHELDNGRKLPVHHIDYNKDLLCNNKKAKYVPLCNSCHIKTNTKRDYWEVIIMYMLENNYSPKQRKFALINLDN